MMYSDKQVVVVDRRGNPVPVREYRLSTSDIMMMDFVNVVLDVDMEMFGEYCKEIQTAPSLDFVMNNWSRK